MGCACLGLSRGRPIALHSPFFRCVGAGHVAAGRRSCCLFHIFHRRTHIGLAAIAIHHTHHPFLKITGHYPGDAILRGRKTRVTFSKALVAANPFREECVAPCSRDRALSASHVRFNPALCGNCIARYWTMRHSGASDGNRTRNFQRDRLVL